MARANRMLGVCAPTLHGSVHGRRLWKLGHVHVPCHERRCCSMLRPSRTASSSSTLATRTARGHVRIRQSLVGPHGFAASCAREGVGRGCHSQGRCCCEAVQCRRYHAPRGQHYCRRCVGHPHLRHVDSIIAPTPHCSLCFQPASSIRDLIGTRSLAPPQRRERGLPTCLRRTQAPLRGPSQHSTRSRTSRRFCRTCCLVMCGVAMAR